MDAYRVNKENTSNVVLDGGGHSYVIRKDEQEDENLNNGKFALHDPYTGESKVYETDKLFIEGFPGDIFSGDPLVRITTATGFTSQEDQDENKNS